MEKQYSLIVLDAEGEMQDIMDPRNGEALDEIMTKDLDSAKNYYDELKNSYKDFSVKMLLK
ncbi:hypothetical protein [Alkalicoccus daliensis]|uniref:Uncharacterized protein n=1 Tax=Alkalicoccus daliensis TaxID=745820 RepID=A0A1H0DR41_9BACI|nr:hypothetical protein [Alkalicoccus daliensis]SDN72516.1 hypothetical protein SAMN04488053_10349 [Alkalicoccus daliensis]